MKKQAIHIPIFIIFTSFLLLIAGPTSGILIPHMSTPVKQSTGTDDSYQGFIKIFIVEPQSRWLDYNHQPYQFGFIDFALEKDLDIAYQDTYVTDATWDGHDHDITITEDNIMIIAVVFNNASEQGYSDPPSNKYPFDAYYVDAAAAATPGTTGYNTVSDTFTHTVFIDEGTGTWCSNCPYTREKLHDIYESHSYPFYYAALVEDKNTIAHNRLEEAYNIFGYPTSFVDGGNQIILGGIDDEAPYRTAIETAGARDVHNLNLTVSLLWLEDQILRVEVAITNNELTQNRPPREPARPEGPRVSFTGRDSEYTAVTIDADDNDLYYLFDWGDGTFSEWLGPLPSGEPITVQHNWTERGSYEIRVKAMDTAQAESDWSEPLAVVVPKTKDISVFHFFVSTFGTAHHTFLERLARLAGIHSL
jgi:hypothetical protein